MQHGSLTTQRQRMSLASKWPSGKAAASRKPKIRYTLDSPAASEEIMP